MRSADIKKRFTSYFERNGHAPVPSASLILDDPTLLFVNAGMVPFKPYLLGETPAPWPRATSVQKCVRTLDIDEVGKTTRHGTFFQMAGNFSFGDYFKEGAITSAWELLTTSQDDGGFGFDPGRLWATVFVEDDEAYDIWHRVIGLSADRIQRRGMADNFWSMGVPGPCGPCSEIYYDRGPEYGPDGGPVVDEDRFLEVWNLVFMQYERGPGPGNEGRGYVLRRLLRRVIRSMRLLGYEGRSLPELLPVSRDCMAPSYPEVENDFERISTYAYAEEDAFAQTLRAGTAILDTAVRETKQAGGDQPPGEPAVQRHH